MSPKHIKYAIIDEVGNDNDNKNKNNNDNDNKEQPVGCPSEGRHKQQQQ